MLYSILQSRKGLIALFLILAILPLTALLLRESMIGVDGYAFVNAVCHNAGASIPANTPFLAAWVFEHLPCNLTILKLTTWIFYLFLIASIALLGWVFYEKKGLLAPLFAFLSTYFLVFPWEFENEFLAMPFLFLTIVLFVKNKKLEAMLLTGFIGFSLWGGAWIYLIAFGLTYLPALIIGAGIIALNFRAIISAILPNSLIAENMLFGGFVSFMLLSIGWLGFTDKKLKPLLPMALFFLVIAVLNGKYAYSAIPLLCLGCVALLEKASAYWKTVLITASIVMLIIVSFGMLSTYPKFGTLESTQFAVDYSNNSGKQLLNDWDMGYYVEYYGYSTNYKGFYPNPDYNTAKNSVMLTQFDLNYKLLKDFGTYKVFEN